MVDKTRKAALEIINNITKSETYGNLALKTGFQGLNTQEKRFATRLVYGTIEKMITIDWVISNYVKKRTPTTLKNIIRMGVYQIYYMDSVPDRATCSVSVDLAKAIGKGGTSGFVNGVLRNIARGKSELNFPAKDKDLLNHLSIRYSCPKWIIEMWIKELGLLKAEQLIAYQDDYSITIRANSLKGYSNKKLEQELKLRNIEFSKSSIIDDAYKINAPFEQIKTGLFDEGLIAIQDEGSMYIGKLAVANNPDCVLDACAAPGGKTAVMAHYSSKSKFYATDIHKHRVELMEKQFERLGVNAKTYRFDATQKPFEMKMDCVLVDAPCSGLGTMFKQPDIKYNKTASQLNQLQDLQLRILKNSSKSVNAGGYLIYSTCTIAKKENYDVVKKFLENNTDFEVMQPEDTNKLIHDSFDGLGIQLLPNVHGCAGFYVSKMRKKN